MSNRIRIQYFNTAVGELILGSYQGQLCLCDWRYRKMRQKVDSRICNHLGVDFCEENDPILDRTRGQLQEYFAGERKEFDVPILLVGTDFQKRVWQHLLKIPYGRTVTYQKLSQDLGDVKAIRAVATANGANAISIIVPCHRIIGSDGSLVGYAGGLDTKRKLLNLEESLQAPTLF